jgi:hypothetical protein
MPVSRWDPSFSDVAPDAKTKTFFEGGTKYYIRVQRDAISGQRVSPRVNIAISNGNHIEDNEVAEGDDSYFEGNQCHGVSLASNRKNGETLTVTVAVTWQVTPFG